MIAYKGGFNYEALLSMPLDKVKFYMDEADKIYSEINK